MSVEDDVAVLLRDSMAQHRAADAPKHARRDLITAVPLFTAALALRMEADALDPEHASAGWYTGPSGTDQHEQILGYYALFGVVPA